MKCSSVAGSSNLARNYSNAVTNSDDKCMTHYALLVNHLVNCISGSNLRIHQLLQDNRGYIDKIYSNPTNIIADITPATVFSSSGTSTSLSFPHSSNGRNMSNSGSYNNAMYAEALTTVLISTTDVKLVKITNNMGVEVTYECIDPKPITKTLMQWRTLTIEKELAMLQLEVSNNAIEAAKAVTIAEETIVRSDRDHVATGENSPATITNNNTVLQKSTLNYSSSNLKIVATTQIASGTNSPMKAVVATPLLKTSEVLLLLDKINECLGISKSCNAKEYAELFIIPWLINCRVLREITKPAEHAFATEQKYLTYVDPWEVRFSAYCIVDCSP